MRKILIVFYLAIDVFFTSTVFAQEKNSVYIYQDEGVSEKSLIHTLSTFKRKLQKYVVKTINAQQVKEGTWSKDAVLFIMPGGADLLYAKNLDGEGNSIIKQYVKNGGIFLGICAGSYYGSSYVEFDKNGSLKIFGSRELSFFKGKAIGPILAPYDYETQSGSRAALIYTILADVPNTVVFYNGGGFFENAEQYPDTKIIATYENNLPAIILIKYGEGKALLSGAHFEYDLSLLDAKDFYIQKIIESLKKASDSREILLNHLMQIIEVKKSN